MCEQMDIVQFTKLSSNLGSDELVELLNLIFNSIYIAAESIGKVWKVELIGHSRPAQYVCVC